MAQTNQKKSTSDRLIVSSRLGHSPLIAAAASSEMETPIVLGDRCCKHPSILVPGELSCPHTHDPAPTNTYARTTTQQNVKHGCSRVLPLLQNQLDIMSALEGNFLFPPAFSPTHSFTVDRNQLAGPPASRVSHALERASRRRMNLPDTARP
jgi:hypothetical protein